MADLVAMLGNVGHRLGLCWAMLGLTWQLGLDMLRLSKDPNTSIVLDLEDLAE